MKSLVVSTFVLVVIGYYVYIPLPENAAESWRQHIPPLMLRIVEDVSTVSGLFGISKVNTTRRVTDAVLQIAKFLRPNLDRVQSEDTDFDGIRVRIYRPKVSSKTFLPGIVYIHGGGWTVLSVDDYDPFTMTLANMSDAVVVSVDYRLAPEHIFPAGFYDCVKATKYFIQNAAKYGVDGTKIGISGDSAGGNLAMAVALYLGNTNFQPKLNFQGLIYPALQAMDYNLSSYREFDIPLRKSCTPVTKTTMISYYNLYGFGHVEYVPYFVDNVHTTRKTKLKYRKNVDPSKLPTKYRMTPDDSDSIENKEIAEKVEKTILNPYFAPLMASDKELKLLPKTYLITAEYDGLRDEGMILANRLRSLNHPLEFKHWDGIEHGFMIFSFYKSYWAGLHHLSSYIKRIS